MPFHVLRFFPVVVCTHPEAFGVLGLSKFAQGISVLYPRSSHVLLIRRFRSLAFLDKSGSDFLRINSPLGYGYVARNNLCMAVLLNIAEIRSVITNSEIEVWPIAAACLV